MLQTLRATRQHPIMVATLLLSALMLLASLMAPAPFEALKGQRESGLEHLSHATLLVGVGLWCVVSSSVAGRWPRVVSVLLTLYIAVLFLEETDWGQVYGLDLGIRGLHHNPSRPATMLQDRLLWFAAPGIVWALWPQVRRLRRSWSVAPLPEEGMVFLGILVTYGISDLVVPGLHDIYQTLAYSVFLWVAVRALRVPIRPGVASAL